MEEQRKISWWKRNWKWAAPSIGIALILIALIMNPGIIGTLGGFGKAYSDPALYENALQKANDNEKVIEILGQLEPIDKMAIMEGDVNYANNFNEINTSVRILSKNGKGMMDIVAKKENDQWKYEKITIRIKNPPEKRQSIEVIVPSEIP